MEAQKRSRRQFDRAAALRQAVQVFWARGYEGATLLDLQKAMGGIKAPSFYAAFGSKETLFREAVALYVKEQGESVEQALMQASTARAAVESMMQFAVATFSQRGKPRGCLVVLGATNCAVENKPVEEFLRQVRGSRHKIIEQRLQRAVDEGEIAPGVDLHAIAMFYFTVLDGLAMQARDGASRQALLSMAQVAMTAWPVLVATSAGSARSKKNQS